jgi:YgiT-type zinc finger domain-containing protein
MVDGLAPPPRPVHHRAGMIAHVGSVPAEKLLYRPYRPPASSHSQRVPCCPGCDQMRPQDLKTAMRCVVCRCESTLGTTTVTFHREGQTVVINEVPAEVCENCGEAYVDGSARQRTGFEG